MPPDLSIAGGEEFLVRGDLFWTTSSQKSTKAVLANSTTINKKSSLRQEKAAKIVNNQVAPLVSTAAAIGKLAIVSPSSSLEEELSAVSSGSSDSEASDFSTSSELSSSEDEAGFMFPPSPPVKSSALPVGGSNVTSPASSVASSVDSDYFSSRSSRSSLTASAKKSFLAQVFPRSKVLTGALQIDSRDTVWQLALTEELGSRVLYARASGFEDMNLRENLVSLLDRADDELDCDQVVVVLDKHDSNLSSILHSLMYVGGVVIPRSSDSIHRKHSSACVLVGIEI